MKSENCPHCNGRIPPGVVSGWAQTVRKRKRERPPPEKGSSASLDQKDAQPRAELITMETPDLIPAAQSKQVSLPPELTDEEISEIALQLYPDAIKNANIRQDIAEFKALGKLLGEDFLIEAIFNLAAIGALMFVRHKGRQSFTD